ARPLVLLPDVALVVFGVGDGGQVQLADVGMADGLARDLARLGEGGEQDRDEHRDDGDDDEQLDEREAVAGRSGAHCVSLPGGAGCAEWLNRLRDEEVNWRRRTGACFEYNGNLPRVHGELSMASLARNAAAGMHAGSGSA